jgi:sugar phosphate permease
VLPSERGFAQGITHAGSRMGGAVTPILVVFLIGHLGWRAPFMLFALLGLAWALVWFWFYRDSPGEHALVNKAERELIAGSLGRVERKGKVVVPWRQILTHPQMWRLSAMYLCYGYCIGVYLSWFPKYLNDTRDITLTQMGIYASLPLMAGVAGDVAGGWISDLLVKRLGNLKLARKLVAIFGFVLAAGMMTLACLSTDPLISVLLFGGAVFGLELTVGVSWAVALDIGDEFAGSVSAVMNTAGNLGATFSAAATGYIVTAFGWNEAFFVIAGLALLAALIFLWIDASQKVYSETGPART